MSCAFPKMIISILRVTTIHIYVIYPALSTSISQKGKFLHKRSASKLLALMNFGKKNQLKWVCISCHLTHNYLKLFMLFLIIFPSPTLLCELNLGWWWQFTLQVMSDSCDPMDCSPSGSSVHGILQARILEWVAISFSRASSWPRNRTRVSFTAGRFFTNWAMREVVQ